MSRVLGNLSISNRRAKQGTIVTCYYELPVHMRGRKATCTWQPAYP